MSKKFAEYSKLDLSNVNKEVLKKWQDGDIFHRVLKSAKDIPRLSFMKVLLLQTVCPVFTM